MALNTIEFECKSASPAQLLKTRQHFGVVGSGDLEVLMEPADLGGGVTVKIVTPVSGFDELWHRVFGKFIETSNLGDVRVEINDNNATPAVVMLRLQQTLTQATS
ncbi:malonate decarboxylase acyl carrier protein [Breoghania sp.]|uniref:malonate decarboxylase acyl carrier protein n=1 Tax=Breoghania sp. TaxID=2065378 RepID=UPI002AA6C61A|nr:malonate decarboxylase acyl carrier protein [Breoghania sp.]